MLSSFVPLPFLVFLVFPWSPFSVDSHGLVAAAAAAADGGSEKAGKSHPDRVHHMPGWDQPLPTPWYSGYLSYDLELPASNQRKINKDENRYEPTSGAGSSVRIHTHYILIKAEDDNDEDDPKPLIYWSNGGPGASSFLGLMTELGPLLLSDLSLPNVDDDEKKIRPYYNPYSWSKLGHILIFDQPAPVGYSYCNDDKNAETTCRQIMWDDALTAVNAFAALQTLYDKFPDFADRTLYLTGESYAGIYIPTFAREVLKHNARIMETLNGNDGEGAAVPAATIPLAGFAVGDGCLGAETSLCVSLRDSTTIVPDIWLILFLAGHGQIPWETYRSVLMHCGEDSWSPSYSPTKACNAAIQQATDQVGGYFDYSLFDECTYRNDLLQRQWEAGETLTRSSSLGGGLNDYPCGGDVVMKQYLRLKEVQEALHVVKPFYSTDNAEGFHYSYSEKDLTGFYQELLTKQESSSIRVLIYNGDTDPAITSMAAYNWTSSIEGLDVQESWRPWTVDGCRAVAGYVTQYAQGLDFLTIRGAGHMVPTYKPKATYTFLDAWINKIPYPAYVPTCSHPFHENKDDKKALELGQQTGHHEQEEVHVPLNAAASSSKRSRRGRLSGNADPQ